MLDIFFYWNVSLCRETFDVATLATTNLKSDFMIIFSRDNYKFTEFFLNYFTKMFNRYKNYFYFL